MTIPAHILAMVHNLAARGETVARTAYLLRISERAVQAELEHPTTEPLPVNTTGELDEPTEKGPDDTNDGT
jgi:hypothetical protein